MTSVIKTVTISYMYYQGEGKYVPRTKTVASAELQAWLAKMRANPFLKEIVVHDIV